MYIILLGAPGAGKGTQAQVLAQRLALAHVASGDLFREAVAKGTEYGLLARSYLDRGLLVPDEVVVKMVLAHLAEPDAAPGVILDGFPRTLEQARELDRALATQGKQIDRVVLIDVQAEALVQRLSSRLICRGCQRPYTEAAARSLGRRCETCGGELYQRPDDQPEVVRKRLEVYLAQTVPLVAYYREQGKLTVVLGEQAVDAVTRDVLDALEVKS